MPPEDAPKPEDQPKDDPKPVEDKPTDEPLGEGGKAALDAERKARKNAEDALKAAHAKVKEFEDLGKSEVEKLTGDRDGHRSRADTAERNLMRLQVGLDKGLTPAQAKRLVGTTKEELEADADELAEAFGGKAQTSPPPGRPRENLRGGGEPAEEPEETDPAKLAARIPRSF